jgi:hypothetical protein
MGIGGGDNGGNLILKNLQEVFGVSQTCVHLWVKGVLL